MRTYVLQLKSGETKRVQAKSEKELGKHLMVFPYDTVEHIFTDTQLIMARERLKRVRAHAAKAFDKHYEQTKESWRK
jgi:hypothetical protein